MRRILWMLACGALLGLAPWLAGCHDASSRPASHSAANPGSPAAHDHEHEHQQLGPHGGHVCAVEGAPVQVEWVHEEQTARVAVYVQDQQPQPAAPLEVQDVGIRIQIAGGADTNHVLAAESTGESNVLCFSVRDPSLLTALQVSEGVTATLRLTIGGQVWEVPLEHHHDHGGHDH